MKNKLLKTILYRITASALAQSLSWILFNKFEINLVILSIDLIQMIYYFVFESIWGINRRQWNFMKKKLDSKIDILLSQIYSKKVLREILDWYDF
jgi:hypothetical protein